MEENQWKIGEIHIIKDETKQAPANGSLAFTFSEKLTEDISREENEDIKDRIINIITDLHEVFVELQERVDYEENESVVCPQCGCDEQEELMNTCTVCGEEYCSSCESMETPEVCESCEMEIENGEDN